MEEFAQLLPAGCNFSDNELERLYVMDCEVQQSLLRLLGQERFDELIGKRPVVACLEGGDLLMAVAKALEALGRGGGEVKPSPSGALRRNVFFRTIENVNYFSKVGTERGVPDTHLFSPSDLSNPKQFRRILTSIIFVVRWCDQPSGPRGRVPVAITRKHPPASFAASSATSASLHSRPPAAAASSPVVAPPTVVPSSSVPAASSPPHHVPQAAVSEPFPAAHSSPVATAITEDPLPSTSTPVVEQAPAQVDEPAVAEPPVAAVAVAEVITATSQEPVAEAIVNDVVVDNSDDNGRPPAEISEELAREMADHVAQQAREGVVDESDLLETDELLVPKRSHRKRPSKHSSGSKSGRHSSHKTEGTHKTEGSHKPKRSSNSRSSSSGKKRSSKSKSSGTPFFTSDPFSVSQPHSNLLPDPEETYPSHAQAEEAAPPSPTRSPSPTHSPSPTRPQSPTSQPASPIPPPPSPIQQQEEEEQQPSSPTCSEAGPSEPTCPASSEPTPLPASATDDAVPVRGILRLTRKPADPTKPRVCWDPAVKDTIPRPATQRSTFEATKNRFIEKWLSNTDSKEREEKRIATYQRAAERAQKNRGIVSARPGMRAAQQREQVWDSDSGSDSSESSGSSSDS